MNQSNRSFSFLVFPLLILFSVSAIVAQPESAQLEPSYEIALHVIVGSNEPGKRDDIPAALSTVSKYLKSNFSFPHYRVANTFLGRISNTGNVEYKSVSDILGQETDAESHTFLEWSMVNLRSAPNGFQARSFRFGARVPVKTTTFKDSAGTSSGVVNYEAIGLTMNVIGLPANTPTLIGTISLPKTTGTIFVVATIKPAAL